MSVMIPRAADCCRRDGWYYPFPDVQYWTARGRYKDTLQPRKESTNLLSMEFLREEGGDPQLRGLVHHDGNGPSTDMRETQEKVVPVNAKMRALVTIKIRVLEQFLPVINTC
ncbi:hypothetical protein OUZ56_018513 [Daphnia magna]|uniref:Uncharacterized protein n=1 Tax=Daphnia magna TaxID=35525 RepID=A0ABQ9Z930_9CRUS|nr:hypothetical protein OUZ56_018513 [Daphnia magna]